MADQAGTRSPENRHKMANSAASAENDSGRNRAKIIAVKSPPHSILILPTRPIRKPHATRPGRELIEPRSATKYSQKAASPPTSSSWGVQSSIDSNCTLLMKKQPENFGSVLPRRSDRLKLTLLNRHPSNFVFGVWTLIKLVFVKLQSLNRTCRILRL